jgi:parallel beta-helix repeat protein
MNRIICGIIIVELILSSVIYGIADTEKNDLQFDNPPKDINWTCNSNRVSDWFGMDIIAAEYVGRVESVEDSNNDGLVGYCDSVVIHWRYYYLRQPYWKYHCEKGKYINDSENPDYGRWKFEFDYNSKSKNPPKIKGCYHYVNDDNTGGPWEGTLEKPFRSIQQALNSDVIKKGDNIYVASGTYNEGNLVVEPHVNLIGYPDVFTSPSTPLPPPPSIRCGGGRGPRFGKPGGAERMDCVCTGFVISDVIEENEAGIYVMSNDIKIYGNTFENCSNAIYLLDSASNISIFENYITDTDFGIFIDGDCNNNLICNNIFYNNYYFNAKDKGNNNWNTLLPLGGNYWDDYSGVDFDGDGFGDTPHPIPGDGNNFDYYPLIAKNSLLNDEPQIDFFEGPTSGELKKSYNYSVVFIDPEYDDGFLLIDWDDDSPIEIFGPIGANNEIIFKHIWLNEGTYSVTVKAIDMYGAESDSATLEVSMPKTKDYNQILFRYQLNKPNFFSLFQRLLRLY